MNIILCIKHIISKLNQHIFGKTGTSQELMDLSYKDIARRDELDEKNCVMDDSPEKDTKMSKSTKKSSDDLSNQNIEVYLCDGNDNNIIYEQEDEHGRAMLERFENNKKDMFKTKKLKEKKSGYKINFEMDVTESNDLSTGNNWDIDDLEI